jgi:osmoprotectant transport system permease protein
LLKEISASLGMSRAQALRFVELPLALPSIITGIRIAAVINVGTATLAAFIGAGGLGEYIVTGLALNNTQMILKGAVPAAILALVIELIFELIERRLTPAHLRKKR